MTDCDEINTCEFSFIDQPPLQLTVIFIRVKTILEIGKFQISKLLLSSLWTEHMTVTGITKYQARRVYTRIGIVNMRISESFHKKSTFSYENIRINLWIRLFAHQRVHFSKRTVHVTKPLIISVSLLLSVSTWLHLYTSQYLNISNEHLRNDHKELI